MPTLDEHFLALHTPGTPLLMPNAWDPGSAKVLQALGFAAIATTSGGFAATLGRLDGCVTREEALEHAAALVDATTIPVSADLENCFAHDPDDVAETVRLALDAGLAGCSVEDFTRNPDDPIYPLDLAAARVEAAADAAHAGPNRLVLTARAENQIKNRQNLDDTIARLLRYQEAGADVLFAPGVVAPDDLRRVLAAVDRPVNVLALPGAPPVSELAALGVARISVGSAFAFAALGGLVAAAEELRDKGTYGYFEAMSAGAHVARPAFRT